MGSSDLENKANQQREEIQRTADQMNREFSPGHLLDAYYFHGEAEDFTGYMKRLREDPIPGALIGAAIAYSASREQAKSAAEQAKQKAKSGGGEKKEQAKDMAASAQDAAKETGKKAKEKASQTAEATKGKAQEMKDRATESSRQAYQRGQETVREHPLMNMAVGFSLGAALGGMMPVSSVEEERLSSAAEKAREAKDQAVDRAQNEIDRRLH